MKSYNVDSIVSEFLAKIEVSRISSVQLWNPWQIMLDLNEGKLVALDVSDMNKMITYFAAHGIEKAGYKIALLSGGISTIKKVAGSSNDDNDDNDTNDIDIIV